MLRFLTSLSATVAVALFAPAALAQTWHRADSANFIIYSDASKGELEEFAKRVELFDSVFRAYFGLETAPPPNRLTIYLLPNSDDVSRLAGDSDRTTAGFYRSSSEGSFAVSNRERSRGRTSLDGQTVLFHEYVHHLMARYFTYGYPAWYREGFAEFFATADIRLDGDWKLGEPADHRAIGLRQVSIPLEQVLFGSPNGFNPAGRDAYYGRSWLLVHLTVFNPERRQQLVDYLSQVGAGEDSRKAFAATFGDIGQLESELERYMRGRLYVLNSQSPVAVSGGIAVSRVGEIDAALLPLALRRQSGKDPVETRDALRALAARYPAAGQVAAELALAERDIASARDEPDMTATRAAIEAALALDPDNARMNLAKAHWMIEDAAEGDGEEQTDWQEIRALIARSRAGDPASPLPALAEYQSYTMQGEQPPVAVVNNLGAALRLAPEAHDVRVTLAYALANENMFDDAIRLVEFLASDPHSGGLGTNVVEDLRRYRDQRLGQ